MHDGLLTPRFALLAAALHAAGAHATCTIVAGKAETIIINAPPAISIPRDAPDGTVLFTSPQMSLPTTASHRCTGDPYGIINFAGSQPAIRENTYPIGTTGLSFRWMYLRGTGVPLGPVYPYGTLTLNGTGGFGSTTHGFQLVKTGPISANAQVPAGRIATWRFGDLDVLTMTIGSTINVAQSSCTTPDFTVSLGTHAHTELRTVGSSTSSTHFNIPLNNCPAGIRSIKYKVDAVTAILDADRAIVALNANSTANGVGVQLLDGSGNVHPFGTTRTAAGINAAGGNFAIPLRARYFRTGSGISGGTANTSMTFTISYE